jgi:magnesium transporter
MGKKTKIGLPPESLVYTGTEDQANFRADVLNYSKDFVSEELDKDIDNIEPCTKSDAVQWINITGIQEIKKIKIYCERQKIHPLVIEDILNINHRPKVEEHDEYLFLTSRVLNLKPDTYELQQEQISFILFQDRLISFQEISGDVFNPIRERIRKSKGKVRDLKADYLLFLLLDTIVDHYVNVIEQIGDRITKIEEEVQNSDDENMMNSIQNLKSLLIQIRRAILPLKEPLHFLSSNKTDLLNSTNFKYYKDVYEHIVSAIESMEMNREILSSVRDLYHSNLSLKMNKIMQTLTITASIFIPLTFIAGVYGMNFKNMPELDSEYGYYWVWLAMVLTAGGLLAYFKKKSWL